MWGWQMGRQLKTVDILGTIADNEETAKANGGERKARKPRQQRILKPPLEERQATAREAGESKPSHYQANLRAKLRKKVQLNFGGIPQFVRDDFARLAEANGMNMRQYLYHLLRKEGANIPPYDEMDGRKL